MNRALTVLLLASIPILHAGGQAFREASTGLSRSFAWSTRVGDFDADGRMDLLCIDGQPDSDPALYRFQEDRTFSRAPVPFAGNHHMAFNSAWGDVNGDGRLDVVLSADAPDGGVQAAIWIQNPDATFSEQSVHPAGFPVTWADLDNDGRLDLVSDSGAGELFIYWSEPGAPFSSASRLPMVSAGMVMEAVDLDGDGDLDMAVAAGAFQKVYRNDGHRHFVDTGVYLGRGVFADMNGDGLLDSVYSRDDGNLWTSRVQLNQGNWRFIDTAVDTGWRIFKVSSAADMDADGLPDLILMAYPRGIGFQPRIYLNRSETHFEPSPVTLPANLDSRAVAVADMDGDFALDLIGVGADQFSEQHRRLFLNQSTVRRQVGIPVHLTSGVRRDAVELAWEPGNSLPATFNLRIGTVSGGQDVMAAASRSDGVRLLPAMGNAQTSRHWHIGRLTPGTYFWSVQAVDWGFHGSSFAAEQTFTISDPGPLPPMPVLSELEPAYTDEDVPTRAIRLTVGPADEVGELTVSVESDQPTLTPAGGFTLSGEGAERSLVITPASNRSGVCRITVRVSDASGQTAQRSFPLTVTALNDAPQIQDIPNQVTYTGAPPLVVPLVVMDPDSLLPHNPGFPWFPGPGGNLRLTARSSDPGLVSDAGLVFVASGLQVTPIPNRTGSVTLEVTASDGTAESTTRFVLLILQSPFQPTGPILSGENPLWADFNNDGWLDLLLLPHLYLGSAAGLVESPVSLPANSYGGMAAFDLDRDNDLDLLLIGPEAVVLFRNDGAAGFTRVPSGIIPKLWFPGIVPVDVDNDGDIDLFVAGSVDGPIGTFRLFLNENGTFRSGSVPVSNATGSFLVADMDHDGWQDLMFSGYLNNTTTLRAGIYRGIGGGRFGTIEPFPPDFEANNGFGLADVDSDGWLDLWQLSTMGLRLYRNHSGQFQLTETVQGAPFAWVDLDDDGDLDLCARGGLLRNDGEFRFTSLQSPLTALNPAGVWFADADNDGVQDALVSIYNPTTQRFEGLQLYTNRSPVLNSPPSPPLHLQAAATGQGVLLSWESPTDLNQRMGFTYNVRVGTTPGGSDVVSATARSDGKLFFVGAGNAGGRTDLILTNLQHESYYWSVQAVDNSLSGGPFAQEQRFLVAQLNNHPPIISDPGSVTLLEDGSTQIAFTVTDDLSPPGDLEVRIFSLDPSLLPSSRLVLTTTNDIDFLLTVNPAVGAHGSTSVRIEVTDLSGESALRLVPVEVVGINDPPVSRAVTLVLPEDSSLRFVPTTDPDGDPLTYSVISPPALGALVEQAEGWVYTPRANVFGTDSAVISARDPFGLTALVRIRFEITPIPDVEELSLTFRLLPTGPVFVLTGEPFAFYQIETSSDFSAWTPSEPVSSETGEIYFKPADPNSAAGFYRVRSVE